MKEQESSGILSSLTTPLSKISLLGPILFQRYKMSDIVNKFLLTGDRSMPKRHLIQPGFIYSGQFT